MNTADPTIPIEPLVKSFLKSLDLQFKSPTSSFPTVESYATQLGAQLKPTSSVIINGKPVVAASGTDARLEFQKKWLVTPLTSHQLNNFDCHLIPGTSTYIVNVTGKVRFDESGRNKLGESADLVEDNSLNKRPVWGSWFGFYLNLVVDQSVVSNPEGQVVDSFDYRITYKPQDSTIQL